MGGGGGGGMAKRMLALLGSPRRSGMVSRMLDVAVQRAEKAGWEVVRFDLYELALLPCTGCMACRGGACCPLPDRLPPLRRELLRCDLCVLAAPVYFANVPGPVKTMFDRLAGSVMEDTSTFPRPLLKKEQRYLLLTACTTPSPFSWLCGQSRGGDAEARIGGFCREQGKKRPAGRGAAKNPRPDGPSPRRCAPRGISKTGLPLI